MIRLKREIKMLTLFLTIAYGVFAEAQSQPQANGVGTNAGAGVVSPTQTTTNTTPAVPGQTAPSEITTVNPMDPMNDSRSTTESDMSEARRRAMAPPASGTVVPRDTPQEY